MRKSCFHVVRTRLCTCLVLAMVGSCLAGCGASYVTLGGPAALSSLAEADVQQALARKPVAPSPARLAVARVQAPGYYSHRCESYGRGRYSIITTRDIETDDHFHRLARLCMISAVARVNRVLIPASLSSNKELRVAAAKVHADLLFVYTFDTVFRVKDHDIGPLGVIALGFLPNHEAQVTSAASAAVLDVRTGFVYGLAEETASENQMTSTWTSDDAVDDSRCRAETKAFEKLLEGFAVTWKGIVEEHAPKSLKEVGK